MKNQSIKKNLDWTCILIYSACDHGLVKHLLLILVIYRRYVPETVSIYFIDHSFNFHNTAIDGKFYEKYASIILLFLCYH
jgi:rod shape determining protein RodA